MFGSNISSMMGYSFFRYIHVSNLEFFIDICVHQVLLELHVEGKKKGKLMLIRALKEAGFPSFHYISHA